MGLLIIFYISCFEHGGSAVRVVSELAHCCGLEIGWVESELIVSSYLIQCILITHMFISSEV